MARYSNDELDEIFSMTNGCCHVCHKQRKRELYGVKGADGWQVDHSKPKAKGGSDSIRSNLRVACTGCNAEKGTMRTADIRAQKGVKGKPPTTEEVREQRENARLGAITIGFVFGVILHEITSFPWWFAFTVGAVFVIVFWLVSGSKHRPVDE